MKNLIIIISLLLTLSFAACNDWLEVKPTGSIVDDELFKNEFGYKQVLTGAYVSMAKPQLYGQELLVAIPDAMAQYWKMDLKTNAYYYVSKYDFAAETTEKQLKSIWGNMYQTIANLNILLNRLEITPEKDLIDYKLIKGEALALRAYLHLDLLRLFGPVLKNGGMKELSIPYRTTYNNKIMKRMTADVVLKAIEDDLLEAYNLLKEDPIIKNGRKTTGNNIDTEAMSYRYRGIRMNYYAVAATLARVEMLKENSDEAYKYAKEVIDANNIFQLLMRADIIKDDGERNLMFEREIIFGLYKATLKETLGNFLGYSDNYRSKLSVREDFLNKVYIEEGKGNPQDYRRAFLWKMKENEMLLYKYFRNQKDEFLTPYDPLLPMIRLSEMYYIAAEAKIGKDNAEAIDLLNKVRISRNLTALDGTQMNETELQNHIIAECRKEFWGEGQMFYVYKRLFKDILTHHEAIKADKRIFELPIPKEEYEFGSN
ncbi:MAG: RagB/SusD family nutrient uptake outer membrane protein [Bacteroidia bacterium]|nr:RagB/SusD family nutrient uptake outer membrane protein [Bacteroidia bacterium]